MNGLIILGFSILVLGGAYLLYGRWLANKWGIDSKAKTPAYTHEDGEDYIYTSQYNVEAAAVGSARYFVEQFIEELI